VKVTAIIIYLHTELVQNKFNMVTLCLDNYHQSSSQLINRSTSSGLAESNNRLARISASQYLNFSDNRSSGAMLPILNNPQDLDPEYLENSFLVQWTVEERQQTFTQFTLCCCLPAQAVLPYAGVQRMEKWTPYSLDPKFSAHDEFWQVCRWSLLLRSLYVSVKMGEIHASCQIQHNFICSKDLCKLSKEYLHPLTCKFNTFFLDKIPKLLTYRTPFSH